MFCSRRTLRRSISWNWPTQAARLVEEQAQVGVLDLVLAAELLDDQLAVAEHGQLAHAAVERQLEAGDQRLVLGDVVGRRADAVGELLDDRAVETQQLAADAGRAGVAAGAAVDVEVQVLVVA